MNPPSTSPHACDFNSTLSTSWWDCSSMHSRQMVKTITNVQTIHHILPIYVIIIIGKKANTLHLDLHLIYIFINASMAIEFSTTCSYIICISIHEKFFNFPLPTKTWTISISSFVSQIQHLVCGCNARYSMVNPKILSYMHLNAIQLFGLTLFFTYYFNTCKYHSKG